jgi:Fic family protein
MKYMTVLEASKKWGISDRRVRFLCSQGRIRGIIQQGRRYLIPDNTEKPFDERVKRVRKAKSLHYNDFTRLDFLKSMIQDEPEQLPVFTTEDRQKFLSKFAEDSSALEGNTLTALEVESILDGEVIAGHKLSEHMIVVGCKDAMESIFDWAQERKPLSQNVIRSIHSLILLDQPGNKGKYQKVKVRIKGTDSSPVYLDLMEPRINDLLNLNTQRKKVMHPIERIARFHLEFCGIHPFEDGNGRTARCLMNLELLQNGYPPVSIGREDQQKYDDALKEYFTSHKAEKMTRLISGKLETELERQLAVQKKRRRKSSSISTSKTQQPHLHVS